MSSARTRTVVVASATVAAVSGAAAVWWWSRRSSSPRASYHRATERDPDTFLANRGHMLAFYADDVRRMAADGINSGGGGGGGGVAARRRPGCLRVLQWNVNVLMGASGRDPVRPTDVAELICGTDADVVLLQEAGEQSFAEDLEMGYSTYYQQEMGRLNGRVRALHALLREAGYAIVVADRFSENPSLVATRLPVVDAGASFSVDVGEFAEHTRGDSRAGRIVRLALGGGEGHGEDGGGGGGGPQLAVLVTHLHHKESGPLRGVRRAEVGELLQRWRTAVSGAGPATVVATVLASDLNFPRQSDHRPREWAVVRAGFERLGEPAEDDGVADALAAAGFRCGYDLVDAGAPAFTHWTGTTVDFPWMHFRDPAGWGVARAEALPSAMSDHLPVVTDLQWSGRAAAGTAPH